MMPDMPLYPPEAIESLVLQQITYPAFMEQIGRLRYNVWIKLVLESGGNFTDDKWIDNYDQDSYHWVVLDKGEVIASARLSVHQLVSELGCHKRIPAEAVPLLKSPVGSLNRLVVHPNYRGLKIATRLDMARLQLCRELGVKTITVEPVLQRIKILESFNFKLFEPLYYIPDLPGVPVKFMAMDF